MCMCMCVCVCVTRALCLTEIYATKTGKRIFSSRNKRTRSAQEHTTHIVVVVVDLATSKVMTRKVKTSITMNI